MAKKAKPTVESRWNEFKDLMDRSGIHSFRWQNRQMITPLTEGGNLIFDLDSALWNRMMEDDAFRSMGTEIDPSMEQGQMDLYLIQLVNQDGIWIPLDETMLYQGKLIPIQIAGYSYDAMVGKSSIPLKFRKAEFTNFSYQILTNPKLILGVKKETMALEDVPDTGYRCYRYWNII